MTELVLQHPREDAKTIIKAALEMTDAIDAYTDERQRIVGKQEASITGGNGARLIIEIPEMQRSEDKTVIEIDAEKEVSIDMATNAEDIKSEFLNIVNEMRKRDIEDLLDEMSQKMSHRESKEIDSSKDFSDTQSTMGARFIIIFIVMMVFTLLFGLMMTAAMMP